MNINRKTEDYQIGLTMVNRRKLQTDDRSTDIQGYHGSKLSPTYARGRIIEIEGVVLAKNKIGSSKGIDFLDSLFGLESIPYPLKLFPFSVIDEQNREWEIKVKVKEAIEYLINDNDFLQGSDRKFRVVLQSEDPRYYSPFEKEIFGLEGKFGGYNLPNQLGLPRDRYYNSITCLGGGNIGSPARIEIKVKSGSTINSPLMIRNLTNNSFFGLDIDAEGGDTIIIDSKNKKVTKNGENILSQRIEGSTRQHISGTTSFGVHDVDGGMNHEDFDVKIYFSDVLL